MNKRVRVGLVGLNPQRGWAATAHVPALRALSEDFELYGVANTSLASAKAAAEAFDVPRAYESVEALAASPEVDVVAVTVKVPHHRRIVETAIKHGKSIYCEWPLGNGLEEAKEIARLARESNVLAVIGTQAVASPEVRYVAELVRQGQIGEVLSSTYIGSGFTWGDEVTEGDAYAMDAANGVTLLSVIGGHALSAVQLALGNLAQISAFVTQRRRQVRVLETGEMIPMRAADQLVVSGILSSGAPLAFQLRGGLPPGTRLLWEINGTLGDLRLTAQVEDVPVINITPLHLAGGRKGEPGCQSLSVPASYYEGLPEAPVARNVAALYRSMAKDLRTGTRTAPSFEDAVKLHTVVAAIESSSASGRRVELEP
jgi:predicted dehydrogenase